MSAINRIPTRSLILSDTHNFSFTDALGPFKLPVSKADVILHCGDLTEVGGLASYRKALKMLHAIEAELKLVIAGNHERDIEISTKRRMIRKAISKHWK
jgi:predicted phosphodiesterase